MDMLETVVFIGSFFIVVYLFVMQPNVIRGLSMFPTFHDKEYILTSKVTYKMRKPERGDVIVFYSPEKFGPNGEVVTYSSDTEYIKRVIGIPGDVVSINKDGIVNVNGKSLDEQYLSKKASVNAKDFMKVDTPITIKNDEVLAMGDNRPDSSDGRRFGPIKINEIIGVVIYRYLPVTRQGPITNPWTEINLRRSAI